MGKASGSFRTTISLPRDLKRRMDAVKEEINWSAVACRAFEEKLGELAAKKEKKAMADIIQRLRAAKQRGADALYRQGYEDGRRWASERAEYDDLVRLEQFYAKRRAERDWEKFFERDHGQPRADQVMEMLSNAIEGRPGPRLSFDFDVTVGERLMRVVCPRLGNFETGIADIHLDRDVWCNFCERFWKSIVGDDLFKADHPSYVRGFAEGALALWFEVKDQL
jgi:hypothetical protein